MVSQPPPELAFLVRRVSEFFLREGLDGVTLASLRGRAKEKRLLEAHLSAPVTAASLRRELGVSQKRAAKMMEKLQEQGKIPPDNRVRFKAILAAHQGGTVTTAALREETGFASGLLDYYIKEALAGGALMTFNVPNLSISGMAIGISIIVSGDSIGETHAKSLRIMI